MEAWLFTPGQKLWFVPCCLWRTNSILFGNGTIELSSFLWSLETWYLPEGRWRCVTFFKCGGVSSLTCRMTSTKSNSTCVKNPEMKTCERGTYFKKKKERTHVYIYGANFIRRKSMLNDIRRAPNLHREAENRLEVLQYITWFYTGPAKHTGVLHMTLEWLW